MKCPNCGKEVADDSLYCEFCGSKVRSIDENSQGNSNNNSGLKAFLLLFVVSTIILGILFAFKTNELTSMEYESGDMQGKIRQLEAELVLANKKVEETELARREAESALASAEASIRNQTWVDLGLPSGTLWKKHNEGIYYFSDAINNYNEKLPSKKQFEELIRYCTWTWTGSGYKVIDNNENFIELPAEGYRDTDGKFKSIGVGWYCYSSPSRGYLYITNEVKSIREGTLTSCSVRLVK